jgi:hypothetical protein
MVDQLQLGDRVRLRGREFIVRGLSPRTVVPGRVILDNLATGEQIEVSIDEIDNPTHESHQVGLKDLPRSVDT